MKFALLGADVESLALAKAATAAGHVIAWRDDEAQPAGNSWEELLDATTADGILVGAGGSDPDERARQIQELAKIGRPMLTVHPVVPSVISYFEIDMARGESGAVIQHFNPLVEAAAAQQLAAWVREGHPRLGAVEQIVATRHAADRSRASVVRRFARDVELLGELGERLDRIGAHAATGDPEAAYASLSVQLNGPGQLPVRWSIEPPAGGAALRVTLICTAGRVSLNFDAQDRATALIEHGADGERTTPQPESSPAAAAFGRFASEVIAGDGGVSTWHAALDAMELADSIEISLRRGRMIDVHHRELTEQLAFKGVMSALGCGVLVLLVPLMLVFGWIAGVIGIPLSNYWPHLLLAALTVFLGLQFLPKLFPPAVVTRQPGDLADGSNSTD